MDVMPCYRFRFHFGHVLPSPIVKIILGYAYEMTVCSDMQVLREKLESTLDFLRDFKDQLEEHLKAYEILRNRDHQVDSLRQHSARLCHVATVNLCTALNPHRDQVRARWRRWRATPRITPIPTFRLK